MKISTSFSINKLSTVNCQLSPKPPCLFLNMVDSFWALFFNTCLPVRIWLTASSEYS